MMLHGSDHIIHLHPEGSLISVPKLRSMSDDNSSLDTSPFSSDTESQPSPAHENLIEELPQVCNYALLRKNSHLNMYEQSDRQQLTISKLKKELKELRRQVSGKQCQIPTQSLVDQGSRSAKKIRNLGRVYGYLKNILLRPSELTPSEYARKFRPEKRFGSHLREGNFRELLDWLPERCQNRLTEDPSFFRHHVSHVAHIICLNRTISF